MERIIDCPVCFDDHQCFEDIQEDFKSYMCFHCGFMSDSRYTLDRKEFEEYILKAPQLVQDLQYKDEERNIVWFPSIVNMGPKGIIYPEGDVKNWKWRYAEVIDIPKSMRKKYNDYDKRLDVENAKVYGQYEFLKACKDMGITEDISEKLQSEQVVKSYIPAIKN